MNKKDLGLLALIIAVGAVVSLINPRFLLPINIANTANLVGLFGIFSIGQGFVIITGGIELSVGSIIALLGVIFVDFIANKGVAWPLAGLIVLALGSVMGMVHGLLITKGRIEPFIVTLGTLGIFRAYLTYFADGGALTLDNELSDLYAPVYYASLAGIPVPVWIFLLVAIVGGVILNRTAYGRYVQAIGSNEQVARYAAVDVDRVKILTYVLLGVCVGIATLLYVPRLGSASPTTGLLWELEAIAAVIVGGTALKGGAGSITGTVVGAILLSVISNILNLTSIISVYLNAAVQGFVIIVVAFLQRGRR